MKRWISLILVLMMIFSLSACSEKKPYTEKEITATELQEKIDNKSSFIFRVERDECAYCKKLDAYIQKTKQEHTDITVYILDSTNFGFEKAGNDATTLVSKTKDGKTLLRICPYFLYTPAVYIVKKGKVTKAGIGFNDRSANVALWDNKSAPDLNTAENEEFWDFIENEQ